MEKQRELLLTAGRKSPKCEAKGGSCNTWQTGKAMAMSKSKTVIKKKQEDSNSSALIVSWLAFH